MITTVRELIHILQKIEEEGYGDAEVRVDNKPIEGFCDPDESYYIFNIIPE